MAILVAIARLYFMNIAFTYRMLVWVNYNIGYPQFYFLVGTPVFLLYFYLFYQRMDRIHRRELYLNQIIGDVTEIAKGDFSREIVVKPIDDLGELAEQINRIVVKSKTAIAEERIAEQTKNELITNVSHDLRTPLTSIIGYLGVIDQDRYRDEIELRYYISIAYEKAQRLKHLIDDLFEYSRLNTKELRIVKQPIDIVELLGQLAIEFRLQLQQADMECVTSFPNGKLMVHADGNKLVRVFENLIANAIDYGIDGKRIELRAYEDNHEIVVEVVNYGESIPSFDLPYVFDRFYRVEKSRTEKSGGSGLGLAISKEIVEIHGGKIAVSSNEENTTFTVRLPKLLE